MYRIHGLTPGQPPPDSPSVLALYHHEDRDRVEGAIREAILSGGEIAFEARVVWPGGEVRQVIGRGTT